MIALVVQRRSAGSVETNRDPLPKHAAVLVVQIKRFLGRGPKIFDENAFSCIACEFNLLNEARHQMEQILASHSPYAVRFNCRRITVVSLCHIEQWMHLAYPVVSALSTKSPTG